jgi:hypothetical protein
MNELVVLYPDKELDVILDNLNTHKPEQDRWLRRHPNVRFHFAPTRASWLNQVEIWFSILHGQSLKDLSCHTIAELCEDIDAFIASYAKAPNPSSGPNPRNGSKVDVSAIYDSGY